MSRGLEKMFTITHVPITDMETVTGGGEMVTNLFCTEVAHLLLTNEEFNGFILFYIIFLNFFRKTEVLS